MNTTNAPKAPFPILKEGIGLDELIDTYDELSTGQRLALKLGSAAGPEGRMAMEPLLTDALRTLRDASVQEGRDNAYYLRGEVPPRHQTQH